MWVPLRCGQGILRRMRKVGTSRLSASVVGAAIYIFIALAGFRRVLLGKADVPKWKCFDDSIWVDRAISHWVLHADGQWMPNYPHAMPFGMKCMGDWAGGWVLRVARAKGSRW